MEGVTLAGHSAGKGRVVPVLRLPLLSSEALGGWLCWRSFLKKLIHFSAHRSEESHIEIRDQLPLTLQQDEIKLHQLPDVPQPHSLWRRLRLWKGAASCPVSPSAPHSIMKLKLHRAPVSWEYRGSAAEGTMGRAGLSSGWQGGCQGSVPPATNPRENHAACGQCE